MSQKVTKAINKLDELQAMIEKTHKLRYKASTLLVYIPCLRKFCNYIRNNLSFTALTHEDIVEFINRHLKHLAPSTVNNYIRQIRRLTEEAYKAGILETDPGKMIKIMKVVSKPTKASPILQWTEVGTQAPAIDYESDSLFAAKNHNLINSKQQAYGHASHSIFEESLVDESPTLTETRDTVSEVAGDADAKHNSKREKLASRPRKAGMFHWLIAFLMYELKMFFK